MNPDNSETETESSDVISGYFDDALSAAECSDLAVRLRSDPAAALEFAQTARVHSLLEAAAPLRPAGRAVVLRRRWLRLGVAAALIAAGVFAAMQYFSKPPLTSDRPHIVIDGTGDFHKDRKPLPPGVNLRTVRPVAASAPASRDHLLENFYVHANPNGLTVPEALQALERAIAEANLLGRKELAALKFTAGRAVLDREGNQALSEFDQCSAKMRDLLTQSNAATKIVRDPLTKAELKQLKEQQAEKLAGEIRALEREIAELRRRVDSAEPRISAPLPGPYTIKEYLDICSLYREVRYAPGGAIYTAPAVSTHPQAPADPDATPEMRTFRLSPALFSQWFSGEGQQRKGLNRTAIRELEAKIEAAKTAAKNAPAFPAPPPGPPSLLRCTGVTWSAKDSTVTVTASPQDLDRWEQVINLCTQRQTVQHLLSTIYIVCPPSLLPRGFDPATGMILSDEKFQTLVRTLDQSAEATLVAAPQIVVRPGQASSIQITCEVPLSQPIPPALTSDWLGLQQDILTTWVGETIQVSGMVDLGLPAATGLKALPEIAGPASGLMKYTGEGAEHHQTGFDLWIPNRCTALFTLDVNTGDSRTVLACLTAQAIDPAGQPTGP